MSIHCIECGKAMEKWGKTKAGAQRYFCPVCKRTTTPDRDALVRRKSLAELDSWLAGKDNLTEVASRYQMSRQAFWKRFHPLMLAVPEPALPQGIKARVLIVDGTYIHGHILCALIAIDENDHIYWRFAPYESHRVWIDFLSSFSEPEIIIMDGQKGLFSAARMLWPRVAIQRCQFHVIAFAIQYIGRRPQEQVGRDLLDVLYELKNAKTPELRDRWIASYRAWEKKYEHFVSARDARGQFMRPRLRSARLIIRRALPYIFTFLDHPGAPNTTNLVEGWVNGAVAEALRRHRGLRAYEKKALVSAVLSDLHRGGNDEDISLRIKRAREKKNAKRFMGGYRAREVLAKNLKFAFPTEAV